MTMTMMMITMMMLIIGGRVSDGPSSCWWQAGLTTTPRSAPHQQKMRMRMQMATMMLMTKVYLASRKMHEVWLLVTQQVDENLHLTIKCQIIIIVFKTFHIVSLTISQPARKPVYHHEKYSCSVLPPTSSMTNDIDFSSIAYDVKRRPYTPS